MKRRDVLLSRAAGIALGVLADAVLADPRRGHPVAVFGRAVSGLERASYGPSRARGAGFTVVAVSGPVALGLVVGRMASQLASRHRWVGALVTASATWVSLGGTSLAREGVLMAGALEGGDLVVARQRLSHLCARDPTGLAAPELARATVESMAENTSDAVVAPLFWAAVAGPAGVLGYRAVNTLDAMVGYRSARYQEFGWASARLDDVVNLVPSRLTGLLTVVCAPLVGGSVGETWRIWRRDGDAHPSPNAGQCEASAAGALGVQLGGLNSYGGQVQSRPVMGAGGREPQVPDVRRASRLSRVVGWAAAAVAVAAVAGIGVGSALGRAATCGRRENMRGALMVAGTTSDAGKSVLTAGICRWLARQGVRVAPFKGQNMSLNSFVTRSGAEIGRAQAMQARACGIEPEAAMNPVLLKPGSDRSSQVVLMGHPIAEAGALDYGRLTPRLLPVVLEAYRDLRSRFDVVIAEGAGSPAEINLRHRDITNMGLARPAGLPVIVVGDIDRGGVFAALHGTVALLDAQDQALISGFVINKFRGDPALLGPGLSMIEKLTGRPVLGTLPYLDGLWLDVEDSLDLEKDRGPGRPPLGTDVLRVAVPRLPRLSNVTDIDALRAEPGVVVRLVHHGAELAGSDLVLLPGTRATVNDLAWLRETGLADAVLRHAAAGKPVLGICGGHQMLGRTIGDDVESGAGEVPGLGLLPTRTDFGRKKVLSRPSGSAYGQPVEGYEIHHGVVGLDPEAPADRSTGLEPFLDGWRRGSVWGTTWHGALENDGFRRAFLADAAQAAGRTGFVVAPDTSFAALREARLDSLADAVAHYLDTVQLERLITSGAPPGLPFIPPGAP